MSEIIEQDLPELESKKPKADVMLVAYYMMGMCAFFMNGIIRGHTKWSRFWSEVSMCFLVPICVMAYFLVSPFHLTFLFGWAIGWDNEYDRPNPSS